MNIRIWALSAALFVFSGFALGQEANDSTQLIEPGVMYIDPLFEYPVAPEDITDFREKCNWLAENFWNPLDLKAKDAVDQAKLNHAFKVYATTVQYADKDRVTASLDRLMKNLQKNPMLLFQITKAAEENIYGPRAEFWIDEMYAHILGSALANKKFPKSKRERYERQLKQLESTMIGNFPAKFDFVRPNGDQAQFFPMSTPTIIVFGDPDCESCRMGKLRMQSNVTFSKAVAAGKVNVLFIIPDPDDDWQAKVTDFPNNWTLGGSDSVAEIYDIRDIPEVYVIGADGKMLNKHISIPEAMSAVLSILENSK